MRTATNAKICKQKLFYKLSYPDIEICAFLFSYASHCRKSNHDREDDGSHCRLEDPEEGQTQGLDESEEVDASLGDVSQVDQVRLVLGWHEEQLQAVHKLTQMKTGQIKRRDMLLSEAEQCLDSMCKMLQTPSVAYKLINCEVIFCNNEFIMCVFWKILCNEWSSTSTILQVQIRATPIIYNYVNITYNLRFSRPLLQFDEG